jgi:hypothetical protein
VYAGPMDEELKAMLVALGPGGTRELAERALQYVLTREARWRAATETVLERWELGGTAEVCERLGVGKAWLGHVIAGRRPTPAITTPVPLVTLSATPVWDMADWDEWAERNAPLLEPRTTAEVDPFA